MTEGTKVRIIDPTLVVAFQSHPSLWTADDYIVTSAGQHDERNAELGLLSIRPNDGRGVAFTVARDNLILSDQDRHGAVTFDGPLVVGEFVTMRNLKYGGRSGGVYQGIRRSDWTGEPVHFFKDGYIGVTPQTSFAIPVAVVVD